MDLITLTERCCDWNHALHVDGPNRLVRNIALAGTDSRNGYSYTSEALQTAVDLYRDKPVFLDHGANRANPQERSTRDLVGSIVSPRFIDGRIRGDIRVLETDSGQTFLKLVESETPGVGMSHVVLARRSADGKTVEQITDVISVDAVVNPATTTTFHESVETTPEHLAERLEILNGELVRLREERDRLQQRLTESEAALQSARCEQSIQRLIRESRLPESALSASFLTQLRSAATDQERRTLIEDRLSLLTLRSPTATAPRSLPRSAPGPAPGADDAHFISAIRRR
jgi:hypothetical protein